MRSGLSILEVLIAVAVLGLTAGMLSGSLSFIDASASRDQRRLEAIELAHRVILQVMSDPDNPPEPAGAKRQGPRMYRYAYRSEALGSDVDSEAEEGLSLSARLASDTSMEEYFSSPLELITVNVYPADESGDATSDEPLVTLSRLFNSLNDPMKGGTPTTNNQDLVVQRVFELMGRSGGPSAGGGGSRGSGAPRGPGSMGGRGTGDRRP